MEDPSVERVRVLALDYGMSRIGVAISDELGLLAHPRPFVAARPPQRALRKIAQLVAEEAVGRVLVGLPLQLNGSESASTRRARDFARQVEQVTGLTPELVDERWSTVQAQGQLHSAGLSARHSRERIDSESACVVLQSWLDGRRSEGARDA